MPRADGGHRRTPGSSGALSPWRQACSWPIRTARAFRARDRNGAAGARACQRPFSASTLAPQRHPLPRVSEPRHPTAPHRSRLLCSETWLWPDDRRGPESRPRDGRRRAMNRAPGASANLHPHRCRPGHARPLKASVAARSAAVSSWVRARRGTVPFALGKPQGARPRFVIHHEQVVDFPDGTRRLSLALRAAALRASHQDPPPPIGGGVANGAKQRLFRWCVKRARPEFQGGLQGKANREGMEAEYFKKGKRRRAVCSVLRPIAGCTS